MLKFCFSIVICLFGAKDLSVLYFACQIRLLKFYYVAIFIYNYIHICTTGFSDLDCDSSFILKLILKICTFYAVVFIILKNIIFIKYCNYMCGVLYPVNFF